VAVKLKRFEPARYPGIFSRRAGGLLCDGKASVCSLFVCIHMPLWRGLCEHEHQQPGAGVGRTFCSSQWRTCKGSFVLLLILVLTVLFRSGACLAHHPAGWCARQAIPSGIARSETVRCSPRLFSFGVAPCICTCVCSCVLGHWDYPSNFNSFFRPSSAVGPSRLCLSRWRLVQCVALVGCGAEADLFHLLSGCM